MKKISVAIAVILVLTVTIVLTNQSKNFEEIVISGDELFLTSSATFDKGAYFELFDSSGKLFSSKSEANSYNFIKANNKTYAILQDGLYSIDDKKNIEVINDSYENRSAYYFNTQYIEKINSIVTTNDFGTVTIYDLTTGLASELKSPFTAYRMFFDQGTNELKVIGQGISSAQLNEQTGEFEEFSDPIITDQDHVIYYDEDFYWQLSGTDTILIKSIENGKIIKQLKVPAFKSNDVNNVLHNYDQYIIEDYILYYVYMDTNYDTIKLNLYDGSTEVIKNNLPSSVEKVKMNYDNMVSSVIYVTDAGTVGFGVDGKLTETNVIEKDARISGIEIL